MNFTRDKTKLTDIKHLKRTENYKVQLKPITGNKRRAVTAQLVWCWATGWMIRVLGFNCWWGLGIFLFTTTSRAALGPTQPPIEWVPGALSLGVKWLGHEADHSPPSSAKVKECVELYLHSPNTTTWHGAELKKSTVTTLPFYREQMGAIL
jgi:hypothetical protein